MIAEWGRRLDAAARTGEGVGILWQSDATPDERSAFVRDFRDELGHRARVAGAFLSAALGVRPAERNAGTTDLDDRLWRAACDRDAEVRFADAGGGALDPGLAEVAIESRTETELSAMHALYRIGIDRGDAGLVERALAAARWHVAELQPDNGTNHPWGIHVFVVLAARRGDPGESGAALMHAQTLLHNCQVQQGRPDRLSACVLWDAARMLM